MKKKAKIIIGAGAGAAVAAGALSAILLGNEVQIVYAPPPMQDTPLPTAEAAAPTPGFDEKENIPEPVYGPPSDLEEEPAEQFAP